MSKDLQSLTRQTVLWATEKPLFEVHYAFPKLTMAIKEIDDPLYFKYAKELPVTDIQKAMARVLSNGVSWAKIAGAFALCAAMAQTHKKNQEVVNEIAAEFNVVLHGFTKDWLEANGSWLSFISYMNKDDNGLKWKAFNVLAELNIYLIYQT